MNPFYKIILTVSLLFSAFIIVVPYFGCKKDKCKGVSCLNDGVCHRGTCTCAIGYEGANCATAWRNKFLGNWTQSAGGSTTSQFAISISPDTSGVTKVLITNFNNTYTQPVPAYLSTSDSLVIPYKLSGNEIAGGNAYYVSSTNITVNYVVLNYVTNELDTVVTQWK